MTNSHLLLSMGASLALTLIAELALAALLGHGRSLPLIALANLMTNPPLVAVCLTLKYYAPPAFPLGVLALEAAAVLAEGAVYGRQAPAIPRPYLFSLGANALSFAIGLIL